MKATPLAAFAAPILAALIATFCAFAPAPASAQASGPGRDNLFAVAGVQVDETAANAATAQQQGFVTAQRQGFERLVQRLTLPVEQQRLGVPALDAGAIERLVLSVDVEEERRSGTRYIGRLTVRYDPNSVRSALRQAGYTLVETRAAPVLIVPVAEAGVAPEALAAWRQAWAEGGYAQELAPLALGQPIAGGPAAWPAVEQNARAEGASSAIYARLNLQGSTARATLTEVSANTTQRDRGVVRANLTGNDAAALRNGLRSLAQQTNAIVQQEWRARAGTGVTAPRARVSASALYANQAEWERIKQALEAAAATLISGIRIEAVGREGALVSFSFTGDQAQLATELRRRGVSLEESRNGPVLRVGAR